MAEPECLWCGEPVKAGEVYERRTVIGLEMVASESVLHIECAARSALGSVGHLRGQCSCYGGAADDPPGMSRREAAMAAYLLAQMGVEPPER